MWAAALQSHVHPESCKAYRSSAFALLISRSVHDCRQPNPAHTQQMQERIYGMDVKHPLLVRSQPLAVLALSSPRMSVLRLLSRAPLRPSCAALYTHLHQPAEMCASPLLRSLSSLDPCYVICLSTFAGGGHSGQADQRVQPVGATKAVQAAAEPVEVPNEVRSIRKADAVACKAIFCQLYSASTCCNKTQYYDIQTLFRPSLQS